MSVWNEIKQRVNLIDYAKQKLDVENRGGTSFCLSPFNGENEPSCALYDDHFKDWSSGEFGDIFDFIKVVEGVDQVEALSIAAEIAGVELDEEVVEQAKELQKEREKREKKYVRSIKDRCDKFWSWLHNRGLSDETIEVFGLGYAEVPDLSDADEFNRRKVPSITIPVRDINGNIVSISYRRLEGEPRYQHFNTSAFSRDRHLYNIDIASGEDGPVYVVEGQFDVMALFEAGIPNAVATYGEKISLGQLTVVMDKFPGRTVVYVPDQDADNVEGHQKHQRKAVAALKQSVGGDIRVAILSDHDANDVLLNGGVDKLVEDVENHVAADRWLLRGALEECATIEAEYEAARRVLKGVKNSLVIEDLCDELSERWNKPKDIVRSFLSGPSQKDQVGVIKRVEHGLENYEGFADSLGDPVFRFPWPSFNDKIRAVAPGHIIGFIARTSVGKTMWMLNLIEHVCNTKPDAHVMFFSLEQPEVEIVSRLLAIQSASMDDPDLAISTKEIEMLCRMRDEDPEWGWRKEEFMRHYANLSVVEESLDCDGIEATINEASMAYGKVEVVFIDYLGLIEGHGDEYELVSRVARSMKNIAKRTGVVMVYLHQLSRKGEDGTKPVTLDQARGSGVIEESVDYLIGAWRPEGTNSPEYSTAILKNRHGTLGDAVLHFDSRTLSITEVEAPDISAIYGNGGDYYRQDVSSAPDVGMDFTEDPFAED